MVTVRGTQNKYFIGARDFELPEVRLLMDAVCASKFITPAKSETLIEKLGTLASIHQAKALDHRLYAGRIKPVNERVYYSAEVIRQAIAAHRQITFQYYEYTPDKEKILKHNGRIYRFSPYDLIWNEDRYYTLGFSENHNKVISFRIDRICNIEETDRKAVEKPRDYSITAYGSKVFDMFDGEEVEIILSCTNNMMKVIIDRFGEDVETWRTDEEHFSVKTSVYVSPTFFGWVFQFCGKIRIIAPTEITRRYAEICRV